LVDALAAVESVLPIGDDDDDIVPPVVGDDDDDNDDTGDVGSEGTKGCTLAYNVNKKNTLVEFIAVVLSLFGILMIRRRK